jgi:hypothetical protein
MSKNSRDLDVNWNNKLTLSLIKMCQFDFSFGTFFLNLKT